MSVQQVGVAFLRVILFMVVWAAILYAVIYIARAIGISDDQLLVPILILTVLIVISFLPYLNYVAKSVFYIKGEGPAIPKAQLQLRLTGFSFVISASYSHGR